MSEKDLSQNWQPGIAHSNRTGMTVEQQYELLMAVERDGDFVMPVEFLGDMFVKERGSSLFLVAGKDEVLEKFGMQPNEMLSQDVMMTFSGKGGGVKPKASLFTFVHTEDVAHSSLTMKKDRIDVSFECQQGGRQINEPIHNLELIEHRLGDLVMTEVRSAEGDVFEELISAHNIFSDCRKGPVTWDVEGESVLKGGIIEAIVKSGAAPQ